jgi:hypothetical protein
MTYTNFTGSLDIVDNYGGTGAITNGKLSYTIETPQPSWGGSLDTVGKYLADGYNRFEDYDDVTVDNPNVKMCILYFSVDSDDYYGPYKENASYNVNVSTMPGSSSYETVNYVYVDGDVTISGKGKSETEEDEEDGFLYTSTTKDFNLEFKTGWNALYTKYSGSSGRTSGSGTETMSMKNPNLKWVLTAYSDKGDDDDYSVLKNRLPLIKK